jgi:hypothetical protein
MSAIKLSTPSSGSISLTPADTASNLTITVPAVSATMATLTTPSFATTIGVGGATPAASGAGITFPATQSASSDANTLDDYEEGEATLQLADAASGGNAYNVVTRYIKIGRMVFLNFSAYYVSSPTWTSGNDIFLRGLPFVTNFEGSAGSIMLRYSGSNGTTVHLWQPSSQNYFVLKYMNFDSGPSGANMLSSFSMYGNVCYLTSN